MTPVVPAVAEVVARYRGRVVDVQHVRWSEPPAVSPAAFLGGGAALLLLGFALALHGLAGVEAAAQCELPLSERGRRRRPRRLPDRRRPAPAGRRPGPLA
ncbi:hypothetical protein [Nannocystis pusilla]|uniref:hypothetical protein n=1 Tax=Nannocystis pusilla TaxID=889268 RepID=UPI003B820506